MVNDLTEQFFQNIKLSLGKLGENFEDKEVRDLSSKLGKVLSESFSRSANMEQLAESVTGRSYFALNLSYVSDDYPFISWPQ